MNIESPTANLDWQGGKLSAGKLTVIDIKRRNQWKNFKDGLCYTTGEKSTASKLRMQRPMPTRQQITAAIEEFFPLKTEQKNKNTDAPWTSKALLKESESRKRLFVAEGGRMEVWKQAKCEKNHRVKDRKRENLDTLKEQSRHLTQCSAMPKGLIKNKEVQETKVDGLRGSLPSACGTPDRFLCYSTNL